MSDLPSYLSYTKQSPITDSSEERAPAMTRDNKDKVGVFSSLPSTDNLNQRFVFVAVSQSTFGKCCSLQ